MKAALALIGVLAAAPAAAEPPALADLLLQVGKYVRGFQHDFATVISDETYLQRERYTERVSGKDKVSTAERTMQSEMLFLWMPEERQWLPVRNVLAVDRKPVADSRARLEQWLASSAPGAMSRLRNLRDESARFNIGRLIRNLSDPTLALTVVDPGYQPRFDFGAIWVTDSGIVMRTRLELDDPTTHVDVAMTVSYAQDAKMGGWLPGHMNELYTQREDDPDAEKLMKEATGGRLNGQKLQVRTAFDETITCAATYSNYRRFETSGRIVPQ